MALNYSSPINWCSHKQSIPQFCTDTTFGLTGSNKSFYTKNPTYQSHGFAISSNISCAL